MKNKELLKNVFNGCVEEGIEGIDAGPLFAYCGCFVNQLAQNLDTKELIKLSLEAMRAENSDNEQAVVFKLLENEEFSDAIVQCAVSLYE